LKARVHFISHLKVGIFVTLATGHFADLARIEIDPRVINP